MSSVDPIERDIRYYVEILRKANVMESTDPVLCKSLLVKCIQKIQKAPQKFLEVYPTRKYDEQTLKTRVTRLVNKYGTQLDQEEDSFLADSSFAGFITEAMERAKILASRFEYKNVMTVLTEAKKMAKDFGLFDDIKIIEQQEKLYASEKSAFDKKISSMNKDIQSYNKIEKEKNWPKTIELSERIINLAKETNKDDIETKYINILTNAKKQRTEQSQLLTSLISELKEKENNNDADGSIEICEKIIVCANQLNDSKIAQQYTIQREAIKNKLELQKADLDTKLKRYKERLLQNKKDKKYEVAIEDCNQVIALLNELGRTDEIAAIEKTKKDLQSLLAKEKTEMTKRIKELSASIQKDQELDDLKKALDSIGELLQVALALPDPPAFEKYSAIQKELREKYEHQEIEINAHIEELEKKLDEYLAKHNLKEAINSCNLLIEYTTAKKKMDLKENYTARLKQLQNLDEKEQEILNSQISQLENTIEESVTNQEVDNAIENINKLLSISSKVGRTDLLDKYLDLKKTLDLERFEQEECKRKELEDKKRACEEEKRKQEDQIKKEKANTLKKVEEVAQEKQKPISFTNEMDEQDFQQKKDELLKKEQNLKQKESELEKIRIDLLAKATYVQKKDQELNIKEENLSKQEILIQNKEKEVKEKEKSIEEKEKSPKKAPPAEKEKISEIKPQDSKIERPSSFPQEFKDLLKEYGLSEDEIALYNQSYGSGLNTIQQLQELSGRDQNLTQKSAVQLVSKGLFYIVENQNTRNYLALPPYALIEWMVGKSKDHINKIRQTPITKIGVSEKDKKKKNEADTLSDLLNSINALDASLNTQVSEQEDLINESMKKLKAVDSQPLVDRFKSEYSKLLQNYSESVKKDNYDDIDFFGSSGTTKEDLESLQSKSDSISVSMSNILEKIFRNLEKLQLGLIQKSVKEIISTIINNEIDTIKTGIQQEILKIAKNPVQRIAQGLQKKYQKDLEKPLIGLLNENLDHLSSNNKENGLLIEELYNNFGKITNDLNNTLSKTKRNFAGLSGNITQSFKSLKSPLNVDINDDFKAELTNLELHVSSTTSVVKQMKYIFPTVISVENSSNTLGARQCFCEASIMGSIELIKRYISSSEYNSALEEINESLELAEQKSIDAFDDELKALKEEVLKNLPGVRASIQNKSLPNAVNFSNKPKVASLPKDKNALISEKDG